MSGGTENALQKKKESKSLTGIKSASVVALIIFRLNVAHFQIFITSYFYTVKVDSRDGEPSKRLVNSL